MYLDTTWGQMWTCSPVVHLTWAGERTWEVLSLHPEPQDGGVSFTCAHRAAHKVITAIYSCPLLLHFQTLAKAQQIPYVHHYFLL